MDNFKHFLSVLSLQIGSTPCSVVLTLNTTVCPYITVPAACGLVLTLVLVSHGVSLLQLSSVSGLQYHTASCVGLLPAQVINVYLGSTLRSMHDVLQESHLTGYIVFACQVSANSFISMSNVNWSCKVIINAYIFMSISVLLFFETSN